MSDLESEDNSITSNDSSDSEEDTQVTEEERLKIRNEISTLSFEDLIKMKEEMGAKLYNETIFGVTQKKPIPVFKRANKNRPREISSKIKPKQLRKELNPPVRKITKKVVPRDPRFDPLCGEFNNDAFKDNYKFVGDIQSKEKVQLEKELKSCTDPERKETLTFLIQRLSNKIRESEKNDQEKEKTYQEKKEIKEKLKKGEKPMFKKKSVKKLETLIDKYEDLKKNNRLQKHIEKRSKKLAVKDRKRLEQQNLL